MDVSESIQQRQDIRQWQETMRPQPPIAPVLMDLVELLPPWGTSWPQKRAWLDAFHAVLDVVYPEPPNPSVP